MNIWEVKSVAFNLADFANPLVSKSNTTEITMVPISRISGNKFNFYKVDDVTDLAESIKLNGLLAPLDVFAQDDGGYRLFSGHRRFKALRQLHDASMFKDWKEIPCIVYEDPKDEAKEELMLIHANSTGRVLSGYEISNQARRIKELLVKLKEKGVDLPGRMRDIVAEEMKISASKLARLEAISNNLTFPGWAKCWEDNSLGESVAYEISQLSKTDQGKLWNSMIDAGMSAGMMNLHYVRRWKWSKDKICREDGKPCATASSRYDRFGESMVNCAGCCACCLNKATCSIAKICPNVKLTTEHLRLETLPQRTGEIMGRRLRELRENTGMDRKEFAAKLGEYQATYSAWENGSLPGSDRICKLADALDVSTDYLFGRSDSPKAKAADAWIPAEQSPEEGQNVMAYYWFGEDEPRILSCAIGTYSDGKLRRADDPEHFIRWTYFEKWLPAPEVTDD